MGQAVKPSLDLKSDVLCVYGLAEAEALYAEVRSWLKKEEERYLVFVEEDEHLFLQAKELPLAKDPKVRLYFYQPSDQEILSQIAWEFLFLKIAPISPTESAASAHFFKELEYFQNGVTLLASDCRDLGQKVLHNLVHNVRYLHTSILGASLKDSCAGMPAIICAAGPSLNRAIPFLSESKDRALLIAGGTAINALNAQGITPHLAAYIDPEPPRDRFLAQAIFETPFAYQSRFSTELLSQVHGPHVWMPGTGSYPIEAWLAKASGAGDDKFESGWTVATFCALIALHLGCDPLILTGMDFSCSPDEIYASNLRGEENRDKLLSFQGEDGVHYHSKTDWWMSAQWISAHAALHPTKTWINLSDGIPLKGIPKKEIADVKQMLLKSFDLEAHLFQMIATAARTSPPERDVTLQLKSSFEKCFECLERLLALWQKSHPKSPLETAEYALVEVELESQVCFQHFLLPLWNIWKHPILRKEVHPLGKQLHRLLFFKNAIETNSRVFS